MPTTYKISTRTSRLITTIENVESYTEEDIQYYDGEYYRDTLDASTLGRAVHGYFIQISGTNPEPASSGNPNVTLGGLGVGTPPDVGDIPDPKFEQDDAFNHEPPRALEKTRSRIVFWSGAGGTGTMLGMVWKDDVLTITSGDGTINRLI